MAAAERIARDMAITPSDFFRLLPRALDGEVYAATPDGVTLGDARRGVTIAIRPLEPRRIALLTIERCEVVFVFTGYSPADREAFLTRFDRAYHRGGG